MKENEQLRLERMMTNHKLKTLNWYLEIMEEGIDTKEVVNKYLELKKTHNSYVKKTDRQIA